MNPDPKKKRVVLKGAAYQKLRYDAYFRAAGRCEYCGDWTPFDSEYVTNGELSHDPVSRGAGGQDILENVKWSCLVCHGKKHAGNL
jgi:hypothetical protein